MANRVVFIVLGFILGCSSSSESDSRFKIGKWQLYQDQSIYTEVWVDKDHVILIDSLDKVHVFSYSLKNDTLSLTGIENAEKPSFMEKIRHLTVIKSVIDGRENNSVLA